MFYIDCHGYGSIIEMWRYITRAYAYENVDALELEGDSIFP